MIWENGHLIAQGSQFDMCEVEVKTGILCKNVPTREL